MNTEPDQPEGTPSQQSRGRAKRAATRKLVQTVLTGLPTAVQLEQFFQYPDGGAPHWINLAVLTARCCSYAAVITAEVAQRRRR